MEAIIKKFVGDMIVNMENECVKVCQSYGFDVNKERLTQALTDARKFYDEGYADGKRDSVEVDAVAQMLYESFGDPHACNFNGNDEWLPMVCDNMNECPDVPDKLFCWKQFIKHYGERRADDAD